MQIKTINQYGEKYSLPPKHSRIGCRAIIVANGKILLSHEVNTGVYLSPGGGLESGEAPEECVVREVREETGYVVRVLHPFVNVNEYFYDRVFVSNYFVCNIIARKNRALPKPKFSTALSLSGLSLKVHLKFSVLTNPLPMKNSPHSIKESLRSYRNIRIW